MAHEISKKKTVYEKMLTHNCDHIVKVLECVGSLNFKFNKLLYLKKKKKNISTL